MVTSFHLYLNFLLCFVLTSKYQSDSEIRVNYMTCYSRKRLVTGKHTKDFSSPSFGSQEWQEKFRCLDSSTCLVKTTWFVFNYCAAWVHESLSLCPIDLPKRVSKKPWLKLLWMAWKLSAELKGSQHFEQDGACSERDNFIYLLPSKNHSYWHQCINCVYM